MSFATHDGGGDATTANTAAATRGSHVFSTRDDRALAAWEIVSVVSTVLVGEWVVFSVGGGSQLLVMIPLTLALGFIFCSHRLWRESARELGWRLDNFKEAARLLAFPMLAASAALVAFGLFNGYLDFTRWRGGQSVFGIPALGFLWGLAQQYVLQSFINRRAQIIFGRGARSILLVAALFAALHLPNPTLAVATFAGGLLWASVFQRAPNLFALALSHSLMTWILASTIPPSILQGLRVGYKFFS
ncbi:MAG TPA: CPBP family glutamic-type intramembrane protease [Pyrinomonadaceae bacterium]